MNCACFLNQLAFIYLHEIVMIISSHACMCADSNTPKIIGVVVGVICISFIFTYVMVPIIGYLGFR